MDIHTYGVTTSRYDSLLAWGEDKLLIPIASNLVLWNLKTLKREKVFHYNSNAVMTLIQNKNFIFSISYNGEVAVLDKGTLDYVRTFQGKGRTVRHSSGSEHFVAVTGDAGPKHGITEVFDVSNYNPKNPPNVVLSLEGRYRFPSLLEDGKLVVMHETVLNQKERDEWKELFKSDPNLKREDKPKKQRNYNMELYDLQTKECLKSACFDHRFGILSSFTNSKDLVCCLYSDRTLLAFNAQTLEIIVSTKLAGTGAILAATLVNRTLYVSTKKNTLLKIDFDEIKQMPQTFDFEKESLGGITVLKQSGSELDPKNFTLLWLKQDEVLVICFEGQFNIINFATGKTQSVKNFEVTCCGLAISNNTKFLACGDLIGNAFIYSTEKTPDVQPLFQTNTMESVRCLIFDSKDESIIIGTLGGKLFRWYYNELVEPKQIGSYDHGVINLRYNTHKDGGQYLLVGLASGMFTALKEIDYDSHYQMVFGYYGHLPTYIPNNVYFGSLHKFAEIWSVCWAPLTNDKVVTASEDQTCMVWDLTKKNPELLQKLTGHTRAVTSVDWQVMDPKIGEIFVSCSDDQTIRIYDPKDAFKLVDIITTSFVEEWHTLTYLRLEQGGTRIAVGAQNGYFFVYDLIEKKFTYAERLHQGSVEGLDWKADMIVTCSADNSISLVRPPKC